MKNLILLFFGLLIVGCNIDEEVETITEDNITYLKNSAKIRNDPSSILTILEYSFDKQGKVISENYIRINNLQSNYFSTFEYDDNGRILKEIRDGEVLFNVIWTNDLAELYSSQGQKISEFNFNGELLTYYRLGFNSNNIHTFFLNYDTNQNIISIEYETEIFVEYLNYDLSKSNPMNLIKSIGILRQNDNRPFFKNIFETEIVHSSTGHDYIYEYSYVFDSENRVYQIEDEKTLIYTQQFEYE